jgi:hypothetical protein
LFFRRELTGPEAKRQTAPPDTRASNDTPVPVWITLVQLGFMAFTVMVAHYPPLFVGGFLFFLAFAQTTAHHQGKLELNCRFLPRGLVVHGGLQNWWIEPVLNRLDEFPLFLGATILTAFNDNAAITYLAMLVPGFADALKYAVGAGAVTGGGLNLGRTGATEMKPPNKAPEPTSTRHFRRL